MITHPQSLNSGLGICQATAKLLVYASPAALSLGALGDVISQVLSAVHHYNRNSEKNDFVGITFPKMLKGKRGLRSGNCIELFGTTNSLQKVADLEGFQLLRKREMIREPISGETDITLGEIGWAWCRDRLGEKQTQGWKRRSLARAERRGITVNKNVPIFDNKEDLLTLKIKHVYLFITAKSGEITTNPLMVTTYGFSQKNNPAFLPTICLMK